ncbi:hypothetical protein WDW37_01360 [Bdellovibrionota bacterium FG-1]
MSFIITVKKCNKSIVLGCLGLASLFVLSAQSFADGGTNASPPMNSSGFKGDTVDLHLTPGDLDIKDHQVNAQVGAFQNSGGGKGLSL